MRHSELGTAQGVCRVIYQDGSVVEASFKNGMHHGLRIKWYMGGRIWLSVEKDDVTLGYIDYRADGM